MRSFKGIDFGTLLSNPKEAEELLPDLKVGLLSGSGYTWLFKMSCFVFVLRNRLIGDPLLSNPMASSLSLPRYPNHTFLSS